MTATHRYLSLGAGVQSSTALLLAARGDIAPFDAAIFADTGWEPAAVYAHLDRLEEAGVVPDADAGDVAPARGCERAAKRVQVGAGRAVHQRHADTYPWPRSHAIPLRSGLSASSATPRAGATGLW